MPRCQSDDDTDIEWTHLHLMDRLGAIEVPYPELAREWVRSMNDGIWVSNEHARGLMNEGIIPPWTSDWALNPHARYNLSGQFCTESYGLIAPGLPNAAARIGAHYARVTVRGEPIQACAFTTAMVALAFREADVQRLVTRALAAVDPGSQHAEMVRDVLEWHRANPDDWQRTRALIQAKYRDQRGWNMNATVTNGAFVVAALLYGKGDFRETLRLAFALGCDADCNAATCGTVLGVMHGAAAPEANPDWVLPQHYDNKTRDGLPQTQTMEEIVDLTLRLGKQVIRGEGGSREHDGDEFICSIPVQPPRLLERLEDGLKSARPEAVEAATDAEARERLRADSAAARTFGALRLARHGREGLGVEELTRVREILDVARQDEVLADLAAAALEDLE